MAVKSQTAVLSKTISGISDILLERTRTRKNLSSSILGYKQRREQEERRQHIQDEISATSMVLRPGGSRSLSMAQTGESFINRIIGFIGYVSSGWVLSNMPTWIAGARELSKRINSLNSTFTGFVQNIGELMSDFGSLSDSVYRNIITFDLTDSNSRVSNSLLDLNDTIESMGNQINEAFNVLTEPFTNVPAFGSEGGPGAYPGIQPAPATPEQPSETAQPSGGSSGQWKPILDVISAAESPQNQYNAIAPGDYNPNLSKMTIAEANKAKGVRGGEGAIGRYQLTKPIQQAALANLNPNDLFSPENQDKIAIALIKQRGVTIDMIKNNPEEASVRLGAEWAGLPLLKPAGRGKVGESYYQGYNGNRATIGVDKLKKAFESVGARSLDQTQTSARPTPAQVSSSQVSTSVIDEVNVAGPSGGTPSVGRTGGTGEYLARGGKHKGIDIGTSYQKGYYVSFKLPGTVTYAGWNDGGYGYLVIIKSGNLEFFFAHLAKIMVKNGQQYNGETIGEIGNTGRSRGEHLHFEVRIVGGRDIDPEPYLKYLSIGKKTTNISSKPSSTPAETLVPQAPSTATQTAGEIPAMESESKSIIDELLSNLTTERKGQQIIFINDLQPQSRSTTMVGSGGDSSYVKVSDSEVLNNFIKNKLLLDLNYL